MNRFHVHLNVADLPASIRFYSRLFAAEPAVLKPDYAKWMLDDPRLNFAISSTGRVPGVDHLGLQAESADELAALGQRLDAAGGAVLPEAGATCCYARSDKLWTEDPQGTRWETFHTTGTSTRYHGESAGCTTDAPTCTPAASVATAMPAREAACCGPRSACC
jgi:catechol 2,3-dioxygenase-like lactoylglutathione lyase family enzyme